MLDCNVRFMAKSDPVAVALERAREAQEAIADWPQHRIDAAVAAVAWHLFQPDVADRLVQMAVDESGIGDVEDSMIRFRQRVHGALSDMHGQATSGVVDDDLGAGIRKWAKPVGVVGVMAPSTSPNAAIAVNGLTAVKTRNAAVFCANPSVKRAASATVEAMRRGLAAVGAPVDLLQALDEPDRKQAITLSEGADLVIATGGASTVKRVAATGRPFYAGGPGNAVVIVDESADLERAVDLVVQGKTFDNGTSCSSESCVVAAESLRESLREAFRRRGGHFCTAEEGRRLRAAVWPAGALARSVVGRSATEIAEQIGIEVEPGTRLLVCSVLAEAEQDPVCREKLSPILGLAHVRDFNEAVALVCRLTAQFGRGHSCGIHTNDPDQVDCLARAARTSRVMVNQSTGVGNSGSFSNGMPFTTTLSCGTWGGGLLSENINWRNFLNYTWVSQPIERPTPAWSELVAPYAEARG